MGKLVLNIPQSQLPPEPVVVSSQAEPYGDASLSSAMNNSDHNVGEDINVTDCSMEPPTANAIGKSSEADDDIIFIAEERGEPTELDQATSDEDSSPPSTLTRSNLVCSNCNYKCSCVDTYRIHMKFCSSRNRYTCKFPGCEQKFVSRSMCAKHFASAHDHEKMYCNTDGCKRFFKSIQARKLHIKKDHLKVHKNYR